VNRVDRLLAMLLELRRRKLCRAEELAAHFEIAVRTVYRDMQALSEMGVPIMAVPGKGYSLMDGYFLPPVTFSPEEAIALLFGTELIAAKVDAGWRPGVRSARAKIEALLGDAQQTQIRSAREHIRFIPAKYRHSRLFTALKGTGRRMRNEAKGRTPGGCSGSGKRYRTAAS